MTKTIRLSKDNLVIHDHQEKPKPRVSRSKTARTALWNSLRESPSNAAGYFDPLTQADFDALIETVPSRWRWAYEAAFDVAMQFEADGKTARLYWNSVCRRLRQSQALEEWYDRNYWNGLGGFFNLMRESLPEELVEIVKTELVDATAQYRLSALNVMQKASRPPKTPRKPIPKAAIEKLARRLAKTPHTQKGALVESFGDKYGITKQTVYRRLKDLNRKS
jgi:hypothetical protein